MSNKLKNQFFRFSSLFTLLLYLTIINTFAAGYEKGKSVYSLKLQDERAVYLTAENFNVTPSSEGDDSEALQAAIDKIAETRVFGIVFIPEGEYEISKTVYVWKGIRLIGYGKERPVFILNENTSGFNDGESRYMIHFASNKPKDGETVRDANPGTFYSALSNINFEIRDGNNDAVAIRSHYAQHCFISHVDFNLGSGKAGIEEVGNEIEDCQFSGGQYGIITTKTSPSWPFFMIDCRFENQSVAAISTEEAGLTIVNSEFKDSPVAIAVNPDRSDEIFISDSKFLNISNSAFIISDEDNPRSKFSVKNSDFINVPVLVVLRNSEEKIKLSYDICRIEEFCRGQLISDSNLVPETKTTLKVIRLNHSDNFTRNIPQLPSNDKWVNIKLLGAKGDDETDDTEVIKNAIEKHKIIYFPSGQYNVSETILLKPQTVMIGLSPIATRITLIDSSEGYTGTGAPVPVIETPRGGENIINGIGVDPGAYNNRAVSVKWMAGEKSLLNDMQFLGGHGTYTIDGKPVAVYNKFRNSDPFYDRDWDTQYWSLWITDGGGGTFKDIWTPNPFAQAGIYVSNTSTPGRLYSTSIEHHVRNEVIFRNVSNWNIFDMQMEEESAESPEALPLRIENCENLTFANLYLYRVIRIKQKYPDAVIINSSKNIEFNGIHVYSPGKYSYDNTLFNRSYNYRIREREIARLTITGEKPSVTRRQYDSGIFDDDAGLTKLADGFDFIDGPAADSKGRLYFVDSRLKNIYRWTDDTNNLELIRECLYTPVALVFDESDNLIITTDKGEVVSFNPNNSDESLIVLSTVSPESHNGKTAVLPAHRWRDEHDFLDITTYSKEKPPVTNSSYTSYFRIKGNPLTDHFISPDGTTFIPQCQDLRRAFSLKKAVPGQLFYMSDEFGSRTYKFDVNKNGSLSNPVLFAEKGELDVAVDPDGNVFIPAGDIFVYNKNGELIDKIYVPERPSCIAFGGRNGNTLFITARTSLYKIELKK